MKKEDKKRFSRSLGTIAAVVALETFLKQRAECRLQGQKKELFGGRIVLELLHNHGAALGMLKNNRRLLLALNSGMLGAAAGAALKEQTSETTPVSRFGLALLLGGGLSNLADRIRFGYVIDYFSIHAGGRLRRLQEIVFNISDFCVFFGTLLWIGGRRD